MDDIPDVGQLDELLHFGDSNFAGDVKYHGASDYVPPGQSVEAFPNNNITSLASNNNMVTLPAVNTQPSEKENMETIYIFKVKRKRTLKIKDVFAEYEKKKKAKS